MCKTGSPVNPGLQAVTAHSGCVHPPDQLPAACCRIQVYQSIAIPATVTVLLLANPHGRAGRQLRYGNEVIRSDFSREVADENNHSVVCL